MTEENVNRSNSEMNIDLNETETNQMAKENVNRSSSEKNFDLNQQVTLGNISDLEVPQKITKLQDLGSASPPNHTLSKEEEKEEPENDDDTITLTAN